MSADPSSAPPAAQTNVSSAYPPPPPFFKHFTPENLARLDELRKADTPDDKLPQELQFLVPPPPPKRVYRSFGETWLIPDVLPTLPQMGITQLYTDPPSTTVTTTTPPTSTNTTTTTTSPPSNTRALSLLRLSKSLLLSYLELLSLLSTNPVASTPKLADLRTIIINMHHLINEYRPHQARETLILMMEEQIVRSRRERDENVRACETVREALGVVEEVLGGGLGVVREGEGGGAEGKEGKVGEGDGQDWRVSRRKRSPEGEERGLKKKDRETWGVFDGLGMMGSPSVGS